MLQLGDVTLGSAPRVAVCLRDNTAQETLDEIVRAGADMVELRIDEFADWSPEYVLEQVRRIKQLPIIATVRAKHEGGAWDRDDKERLELYRRVAPHVQAIDIELSSLSIVFEAFKLAARVGILSIGSYHNFSETPDLRILEGCARQAQDMGADVAKIATFCAVAEDVRRLATFTASCPHAVISMGMGPYGGLTRILFPALGSQLVYAACGRPTAPGQLSFQDTIAYLRAFYPEYNRDRPDTREYSGNREE